jgi:phosphotriesterase-related protein
MTDVQTTAGEVSAADLGLVLMHEHVLINSMREERSTGLLNDEVLMAEELGAFADAGGGTIVDLTTAELTSGACGDPTGRYRGVPSTGSDQGARETNHILALGRLAELSGVNIVLGTGHYRDPFIDTSHIDRFGTDKLADSMVNHLRYGFGETGIRAGIIGEIGADKWRVSAVEERSFRAAARAQLQTGVAISTHAARWPVGMEQLEILTSEGVDPRRIIIGHCDTVGIPEYHIDIAKRGAFVQFDTIRGSIEYDTRRRVGFVMDLVLAGYADQILLSHDVCSRTHLLIAGGNGYTFVPGGFSQELSTAGLELEVLNKILFRNPVRALTGVAS